MKANPPATRVRDDERAVEDALDRQDYRGAIELLKRLDQRVAFAIADICGESADALRLRVSRGFAELQRLARLHRESLFSARAEVCSDRAP
jgi:hypothetical protein